MDKVFSQHPAPWTIQYNCSECGNGGAIHCIVDANGETVFTSYADYGAFTEMWALYNILTDEQKERLGQPIWTYYIFNGEKLLKEDKVSGALGKVIETLNSELPKKKRDYPDCFLIVEDSDGDTVYQLGKGKHPWK